MTKSAKIVRVIFGNNAEANIPNFGPAKINSGFCPADIAKEGFHDECELNITFDNIDGNARLVFNLLSKNKEHPTRPTIISVPAMDFLEIDEASDLYEELLSSEKEDRFEEGSQPSIKDILPVLGIVETKYKIAVIQALLSDWLVLDNGQAQTLFDKCAGYVHAGLN